MSGPDPAPQPKRAGCVAIALVTLGLLILVPSGLCTGFFTLYPLLSSLFDPSQPASSGDIGFVFTFGMPFVVVGGLLTALGFSMMRRR